MITLPDIEAALEPLRQSLRPDGADLAIEEFGGGAVTVQLQLQSDACLECIVSAEILEGIMTHQLESAGMRGTSVTLKDPRATA